MTDNGKTRVLILGAGFAGLETALRLDRALRKNDQVEITLVDQNHFQLFTPLLAEAASGVVPPALLLAPVRRMLHGKRVRFVLDRVNSIDLAAQKVNLCCGEAGYDILVIALGSVTNFYGLDSVREKALELKYAGDAERMRCHVVNRFQAATRESDARERRRLLTFAVVGAGNNGVEVVTELQEFVEHLREEQFTEIAAGEVRTVLIDFQDRALPEMEPSLSRAAQRRMEKMGIEMMLNSRVTGLTGEGLTFGAGREPLPTDTVIWATGVQAPPVVSDLPLDKDRFGRIAVGSDLRVPGMPNVYVLGDAAGAFHPETGEAYPPTAQVAYRQAPVVAANIAADIQGGKRRIFDFDYIGDLVSLGKLSGVANPFGLKLRGFLAWFMWKGYYWLRLAGWQNRLRVLLNWVLSFLAPKSSTMAYDCALECEDEPC